MKSENIHAFLMSAMLIATSLLLTACANLYPELVDYEASPKTAMAQKYTYGTDVMFDASRVELSDEEVNRLADYIQRMAVGKYDRVNLITYGDEKMSPATSDRIRAVQHILETQGIRIEGITRSTDSAEGEDNRIRVLIDRYLVTLPGCPDWTKSATGSFDNQVNSNWGCATAMNLGDMIAEPHDLITGRGDTYTDGNYALLSIQHYQSDATKKVVSQPTGDGQ